MLVLSRGPREQLFIGPDIVVTNCTKCRVRLGIAAPDETSILRRELVHGSAAPPTSLVSGQDLLNWSRCEPPNESR